MESCITLNDSTMMNFVVNQNKTNKNNTDKLECFKVQNKINPTEKMM